MFAAFALVLGLVAIGLRLFGGEETGENIETAQRVYVYGVCLLVSPFVMPVLVVVWFGQQITS